MKTEDDDDEAFEDPSNSEVDIAKDNNPRNPKKGSGLQNSGKNISQAPKNEKDKHQMYGSPAGEQRRTSVLSGQAGSKKSGIHRGELLPSLVKNSKLGSSSPVKKKVTLPPEDKSGDEEGEDPDAEMYDSGPEDNDPLDFDDNSKPSAPKNVNSLHQSSHFSRLSNEPRKKKLAESMIDPLTETQHAVQGKVFKDDTDQVLNELPGQSNANKKSKVSVKVRFPDEDSSASKISRTSKGSSFLDGESKDLNEQFVEEKAKKEYDRFYPVFKEVYKLRTLKKRGYKVDKSDFFVAYLQGIKKADEAREEEQKTKNKEFFDSVRKIIDHQDKRTKELMVRLEERQLDRREEIEERIANLGQFMLGDIKKQKEDALKIKASKAAKEKEHFEFLMKMGLQPNHMMHNVKLA